MVVPEKIYPQETTKIKTKKLYNNDVAYIRTDVFTERACDVYCKACGHFPHIIPYKLCRYDCPVLQKFREHIKGE